MIADMSAASDERQAALLNELEAVQQANAILKVGRGWWVRRQSGVGRCSIATRTGVEAALISAS